MQTGFRRYVQGLGDKTPKYYLEKLLGFAIAVCFFIHCNKNYTSWCFVTSKDFTDRLLTICVPLFGFLLVILTLIIQNSGFVMVEMKKKKSYGNLINFNKKVILLSASVSILSLFILFVKDILTSIDPRIYPIIGSFNLALFIWTIVDTFFFVRIFYTLVSQDTKNEKSD
jgi:hypothetical protein